MSTPTEPESIDMLFVQVCRLHHTRAHTLLEEIGLYRGQPPVLRFLADKDGLTQTDLASRLQVTPATMTKMIQRMEKTGFVQRRSDADDQRVSRVYLTEAGRAIQAEMSAVLQTIEADAFARRRPIAPRAGCRAADARCRCSCAAADRPHRRRTGAPAWSRR
jgi:DNA-binding MarR family transcriptional regulator